MSPSIKHGDFVFAAKYFFSKPRKNDIIVFNHSKYGTCIKKVTRLSDKMAFVEGLNKNESLKTEEIGPIDFDKINFRVLYIFKSKNH